jgi:hypothetical protein
MGGLGFGDPRLTAPISFARDTFSAQRRVAHAINAHRAALASRRQAGPHGWRRCDSEGRRGVNVTETGLLLRTKSDRCVCIKGRPETDLPAALCDSTAQAGEMIPLAALKESVNKAAYAYTEKHVGPKEKVGNKGGSVPACATPPAGVAGRSNRLRAALNA